MRDTKLMPLWQHLEDLRWTIVRMLGILLLTSVVSFFFIDSLFNLLMQPLDGLVTSGVVVLNQAGPFDGMIIRLKSGLLSGFLLSTPFLLLFVWNFVSPALHTHERVGVWWICGVGTLLFLSGAGLGFLSVGKVLPLLVSFSVEGVSNIWTLRTYFDFLFYWVLGAGLMFELPLILVMLVRCGILEVMDLRRGRPFAMVGIFIIAALCTPPDPITQLMMAAPLILLYELGIFVAGFGGNNQDKEEI